MPVATHVGEDKLWLSFSFKGNLYFLNGCSLDQTKVYLIIQGHTDLSNNGKFFAVLGKVGVKIVHASWLWKIANI